MAIKMPNHPKFSSKVTNYHMPVYSWETILANFMVPRNSAFLLPCDAVCKLFKKINSTKILRNARFVKNFYHENKPVYGIMVYFEDIYIMSSCITVIGIIGNFVPLN